MCLVQEALPTRAAPLRARRTVLSVFSKGAAGTCTASPRSFLWEVWESKLLTMNSNTHPPKAVGNEDVCVCIYIYIHVLHTLHLWIDIQQTVGDLLCLYKIFVYVYACPSNSVYAPSGRSDLHDTLVEPTPCQLEIISRFTLSMTHKSISKETLHQTNSQHHKSEIRSNI